MISIRIKGLLALLVVFMAGAAVGVAVSVSHPWWFARMLPAPGPEGVVRHLSRTLDLDAEQRERVLELFLRHHPEMEAEMSRGRRFRDTFLARMFAEMEPLLRPEQRDMARKLLDKQRKVPFPPPPPPPDE